MATAQVHRDYFGFRAVPALDETPGGDESVAGVREKPAVYHGHGRGDKLREGMGRKTMRTFELLSVRLANRALHRAMGSDDLCVVAHAEAAGRSLVKTRDRQTGKLK